MAIVSARRDITRNLAALESRDMGLGWPDFLDSAVGYVGDKVSDVGSGIVNVAKATPGVVWGGTKSVVGAGVGFVKDHPSLLLATPLAPLYLAGKGASAIAKMAGGKQPDAPAAPSQDTANAAAAVQAQMRRRVFSSFASMTAPTQDAGVSTTPAVGVSTAQQTLTVDPAAAAAAAAEEMAGAPVGGFAGLPTMVKVAIFGGGALALGFVGWKLMSRRGGGRRKS